MDEKTKKEIVKQYANRRIDKGDSLLALEEIELFLDCLSETLLTEISNELKNNTSFCKKLI